MIGGIAFLSSTVPVVAMKEATPALTFEYAEDPMTLRGFTTNRYPNWTCLGTTPHTDSWTVMDAGWHEVWNFYLYEPLKEDYAVTGHMVYYVDFYVCDNKNGEASFRFVIHNVDENDEGKRVHHDTFKSVELDDECPDNPLELEGKEIPRPYTFLTGFRRASIQGKKVRAFEKRD